MYNLLQAVRLQNESLPNALFIEREIHSVKKTPEVETQELFLCCFSFYFLSQCFFLLHASQPLAYPLNAKWDNHLSIFIAVV